MTDPGLHRSELYSRIERLIRTVRRRRNLRMMLRGTVATVAVALGVFFASSWAMDQLLYTERSVSLIRALSWVTVACCFISQLVLPFLRRPSDRQIALYIEEHEPDLESALITALEVGSESSAHDPALLQVDSGDGVHERLLYRRLLADTIERCERIDFGKGIERGAFQRASGGLALVAGLSLLLALLSPAFLRHGASLLMFPWKTAAIDNPYDIVVSPSDQIFAKGADIPIQARLQGFTDPDVRLALKIGDASEWTREDMVSGANLDSVFGPPSGGLRNEGSTYADYESLLIAMDQSFSYFVEASGIRSQVIDIEVIDLPYTKQIDLLYRYPAYAGVAEELVENAGDIAALRGARVEIRVTPTMATDGVRLVVEGSEAVDMVRGEEDVWTHELEIQDAGFYHLEMLDKRGRMARGSADYGITPLDDRPPMIEMRNPGRDLRVSKIEEIFIEAAAEDDYGIRAIDLHYSVNGGAEDSKRLMTAPQGAARKKASGTHTFFLEEVELLDGDFISYYATARDGRPGAGARTETSDIYFLEVRPFGQDYRKADSGGGGGGGGQGGADSELSKRQREVVAATFALMRDKKDFSTKEFNESVATVALSQTKLREQVQTLMTRMGNRDMLMSDEEFAQILEYLESALAPMNQAIEELTAQKLAAALMSEQQALSALQRAEAMFREVRVSFDPGGGGGGSGEMAEDLADLFELELDKLRNQYETVQRGQQQGADQKVDELEERLRELARRQQKENERKKRLGQQSSAGQGAGQQQELIDETEELARQLERLAREQSSPELRQTAKQLEQAVDQMKRAGSEGQAKAGSAGSGAAQALEDARRLLDKSRRVDVKEGVSELESRAQNLTEQQQRMRDEVEASNRERQATGATGPLEREQLQNLMERKQQIQRQVDGLEEELDRLARQSRTEEPELARALQQAANDLRTSGVSKKIEYSQRILEEGDMELGSRFEQVIEQDLQSLLEGVEDAAGKVGEGGQAAGEDALEQARDLVEGLESLEQRLRDGVQAAQAGQESQEEGQGPGQSGESQEGSGQQDQGEGQQAQAGEGREGQGQQPGGQPGQTGQGQTGEGQPAKGQSGERSGSNQGREGTSGQGGSRPSPGADGRSMSQAGQQGNAEGQSPGERLGQGAPALGSGSSSGSLQPGAFSAEDIRQLSREVRERLLETEELRQSLEQQGVDVSDLKDIQRNMNRLDTRQLTNDPLALEALRRNIEELRHFEFGLWRELGRDTTELRSPRAERAPEGYEDEAERYFRSLATEAGGQRPN